MIVETFPVGTFRCNCTIVGSERTKEAVVIDPGDEPEVVLGHLARLGLAARYAFHTHAHIDHVMATRQVKIAHGAEILLHRQDLPLYASLQLQATLFGMHTEDPLPVDTFIEHGDELTWGDERGAVIHTPGHTPGSVCLYLPRAALLFTGDTLFRHGVGRTDTWGGSYPDLVESIRSRLYALPGETRVVPGHGPATVIAAERQGNPFVHA